jgi:hypothetical protein
MIIFVILFFTLVALIELVPLYKNKYRKEFWTHLVFLTIALSIAVLLGLGIKLPSPAKPIENLIKPISGP